MNVIERAARNLPGRWHKGSLTDNNDNWCGIGHVLVEAESVDEATEARKFMDAVASEQFPERAVVLEGGVKGTFAMFNDHSDTTEDEVVAVMEKAAVLLDEQI
jgi:hypothetical protein